MSRYIDADKLIEHLDAKSKTDYEMGLYNHGALTESFIRFVERQPTADVVEVVRCKDCKYYKVRETAGYGVRSVKSCCRSANKRVNEEDYCSYGERREE
jgi:hypothetical protein